METLPPDDREHAMNAVERDKRGTPTEAEYRVVRPDGETVWILDHGLPIRNAAGEVYRYGGVAKDVIEHQELEKLIRRHTEELEALVDERTKRLRELEQHRAENEKLAATGRMAARIAHEINNPLAGIKNSFRLIKKAVSVTHAHYKYTGLIEAEIERIANIVRLMFDLYRPDYEAVRNFPADFAIRDVVTLLKGSCLERRVTIDVEIKTPQLTVALSENSLRQVLYNIIQNAVDASPPEETIRITAELEVDRLLIRVADRGNGIPEEIRPRIFEPFFTTKSGFSRSGLGLGLSVSKSLVEAMHGALGYETAIGAGTVFWVALPLANAFAPHELPAAPAREWRLSQSLTH